MDYDLKVSDGCVEFKTGASIVTFGMHRGKVVMTSLTNYAPDCAPSNNELKKFYAQAAAILRQQQEEKKKSETQTSPKKRDGQTKPRAYTAARNNHRTGWLF